MIDLKDGYEDDNDYGPKENIKRYLSIKKKTKKLH